MNSLYRKLLEEDKIKHMYWSGGLLLLFYPLLALPMAIFSAATLGLAKEFWDDFFGSGFCWYDMLANQLGIVMGIAFIQLVGVIL